MLDKRELRERKKINPQEEQIKRMFEKPCIFSWSDGHTSPTTLATAFTGEEDYRRYLEYKRSGKPYPIKIEAVEPPEADKEKKSSIFPDSTIAGEYEVLQQMCKGFTDALMKFIITEEFKIRGLR